MGNCRSSSKFGHTDGVITYGDIANLTQNMVISEKIPLDVQVAHFTPSTFPLLPIINRNTDRLLETSWHQLLENGNEMDEYGTEVSGVTLFYNEFYDRLDRVDSNGVFEAVLSRHAAGNSQSKIAAKGTILIRMVSFALTIARDIDQSQLTLYMVGKSHAQKEVRPWQYSIFVQTLLQTIASRLGSKATNDVMEAWVHIFAFILRSVLPPAIENQTVETELNVNTSSEFSTGRVFNEIAEIEEVKEATRKGRSVNGSSYRSGSEISQ